MSFLQRFLPVEELERTIRNRVQPFETLFLYRNKDGTWRASVVIGDARKRTLQKRTKPGYGLTCADAIRNITAQPHPPLKTAP